VRCRAGALLAKEAGRVKRGTTEHPKTYTLAAVLNVPRYAAVGVLESLWHFAQKYAVAGDVGRHSDEAIARAIGWDGNAATLVSGLVQAGWLDRCVCHRVRVHDWHEHADLTVRRTVQNVFLYCYQDPKAVLPSPHATIATVSAVLALASIPEECIGGSTVSPAVPCRALPSLAEAVSSSAPNGFTEPITERPDVLAENAIRKALWNDQRELLGAVGRIAAKTGRDPPEIMREVTAYKRPDGSVVGGKVNPAMLTPERLEKSLDDARAWLADLESDAAQETGS
jgi:hypothetical protein